MGRRQGSQAKVHQAKDRRAKDRQANAQIEGSFLAELQAHVAARQIESGLACLASHKDMISCIDPSQANAARLLALLAIWIDIGFATSPSVKELLSRFDLRPLAPSDLRLLCLRMAQGMVAMAEEAMDTAIPHFDFVLGVCPKNSTTRSCSLSRITGKADACAAVAITTKP